MAKQVTIVSGDVSEESVAWLLAHGAMVESAGLLTISLPEKAQVHKGNRGWDYSIAFYNAEGNDEESWLEVELYIDAYETQIRLKYSGDRDCRCKGRGCALCNDELRSIARGENPYAHHTAVLQCAKCDKPVEPKTYRQYHGCCSQRCDADEGITLIVGLPIQ